jgi:cbb3-type cytochrome oxidase cytochrome c subunit
MDIVERLRQEISGYTDSEIEKAEKDMREAADEIEALREERNRLREDLDLVNQIGRIEIDAKLRYAAALRTIANNEVAEHADVDMIRDFANEALKWRE